MSCLQVHGGSADDGDDDVPLLDAGDDTGEIADDDEPLMDVNSLWLDLQMNDH